ncbi:hypothetical protein OEZ86_004450 [Tetradesmus obliquus]|nr:hypothetical protein OEZ86_004450 [Tetradesmus obliquus]
MYKARDLDEQGVDDGLIARMGRWLRTALNLCYLRFFKPQGLLAAAGWPQDQMDAFFAERFCLAFDNDEEMAELAAELLPVKEAQAMVDKMTRKQLAENPSAGALAIVMDYLGRVGAQDSCGLLCCENEEVREAAAGNPSIKFMLEKPRFRRLLAIFKDKLAAGGCEHLRPRSTRERVMDLAHGVQEIRDMLLGRRAVLHEMDSRRVPRDLSDAAEEQQQPSVKSLWDWYTAPVSGGMSVQQCEEKQPPDTTWRSKQPHGKARWREVRLILDRIKELQVTSGSIRAALEAAEGEREELKLAVPGYSRHLAALAKEKNKEKGSKSG